MADSKKYNGNTWEHSLRKLATATDTFTTLPVDVYSDGNNATVGISGNTVQSGTPTPDNPVMPNGTGERTGNLWGDGVPVYSYTRDYKKYNPDNAVYMQAGTYTISTDGKLPNIQAFDANHTQYSISEIIAYSSVYYSVWDGLSISPISTAIHTATITILADCIITFTVVDNRGTYIMLNSGSTALPYEPYGYKIPISSAGQTTPVYLGEVVTTRKIKKLVLTGNESVSKDTGQDPTLYFLRYKHIQINGYCTHLRSVSSKPQSGEFSTVAQYDGYIFLNFGADIMNAQQSGNTVEGFKEYLAAQYAAGTPVTVWYVLATPTTGIVNEPLRKIGDYADEISGITIPVTAGGDTISVDTTLQPSEVTVNYKGWHPVQSAHEKSVNLALPLTEWVDGYVNQSDGSITPPGGATKEKTSDYIAIQAGQGYSFSRTGSFPSGGYGAWRGIGWYDSNKVFISRAQGSIQDALSTSAPSNAAYCRICFRTYDETTDTMFNKGLTALPYEPYWK